MTEPIRLLLYTHGFIVIIIKMVIMTILRLPQSTPGTPCPRSKGDEVSCFPTPRMARRSPTQGMGRRTKMRRRRMRRKGSNATIFPQNQGSQIKVSRLRYLSQFGENIVNIFVSLQVCHRRRVWNHSGDELWIQRGHVETLRKGSFKHIHF